ncbi:TetR family transcriptional regulator protein (plasmid) [Rhizobium gallicum]|uniref:TetR family transcriptional regulator protein n=2 Tax=Rhizobium gallicum TaxID=56730 RepID=A0A1L5NSH1_9HYPH|nr:TetR family transcriptional regulator protein [Rhizobium gallicum]
MPDKVDVAEVRERILDVAETYIRHIGHRKTNVADIADKLGMSRASIYRFFPTRAAIDQCVYARHANEMLASVKDIAQRNVTARARLIAILETLHHRNRQWLAEEPHVHALFVAAANESWVVMRSYFQQLTATLDAVIRDAIKESEREITNPARAAECVITAMISFLHPVLVEQRVKDGGNIDADLDSQIRFIMQALGMFERCGTMRRAHATRTAS